MDKNENGYAYVTDGSGNKAKVITAETSNGTKYLKTEADNTTTIIYYHFLNVKYKLNKLFKKNSLFNFTILMTN
ncbi:DUF3892 domain-containing protein [Chryseobacterium camelliae]|uniref:DUF3892 domain-containing protein n=1 Tax=Chryseobacterium camelliae TaxID=1265445 RepID=UPI0012FD938F